MKPKTILRILSDALLKKPLKESYWTFRKTVAIFGSLFKTRNRLFARVVAGNFFSYLLRTASPLQGETESRIRAAVEWILLAQKQGDDDGVSLGYFPCENSMTGWKPSYPETTGYIISSILNYARLFDDSGAREAALRMAHWETEVQMPCGAVQGGFVCAPDKQTPTTFNTGMVLDGWCSAYSIAPNPTIEKASRRAAEFLLNDQTEDGYFRTNGAFVTNDTIKNYNCLCAWALYRHGKIVDDQRFEKAAVKAIEAAQRQQQPNGWFANNCLTRPDAPLLHTLGYTLQGILEIGILTGRDDFLATVKKGVDPILATMSYKGYLPGRFYSDWSPASFSSCLTGSAQLAIVCYRFYEYTQNDHYLAAANRIMDYLKTLQIVDTPLDAAKGAIAGSYPILGSYMQGGYPNWATKYFIDGLILQYNNRPGQETHTSA